MRISFSVRDTSLPPASSLVNVPAWADPVEEGSRRADDLSTNRTMMPGPGQSGRGDNSAPCRMFVERVAHAWGEADEGTRGREVDGAYGGGQAGADCAGAYRATERAADNTARRSVPLRLPAH